MSVILGGADFPADRL